MVFLCGFKCHNKISTSFQFCGLHRTFFSWAGFTPGLQLLTDSPQPGTSNILGVSEAIQASSSQLHAMAFLDLCLGRLRTQAWPQCFLSSRGTLKPESCSWNCQVLLEHGSPFQLHLYKLLFLMVSFSAPVVSQFLYTSWKVSWVGSCPLRSLLPLIHLASGFSLNLYVLEHWSPLNFLVLPLSASCTFCKFSNSACLFSL